MILDDIRVVLVNTSHSGNIGSAARAMKTMGLSKLYLVDPACEIDSHASALSAGASDVLGNAVIVDKYILLSKETIECDIFLQDSTLSPLVIGKATIEFNQ